MIISRRKARTKIRAIACNVYDEIKLLAESGKAYTCLYAIPNGRRLARYSRAAGYRLEVHSMFGRVIGFVLLGKRIRKVEMEGGVQ